MGVNSGILLSASATRRLAHLRVRVKQARHGRSTN